VRRVVMPDGLLVLTAQGESSIAYAYRHMLRSPFQLREIRTELYRCGYWHTVESGADRGTTFLSSAWLLERATPAWELALLRPGVAETGQDLYVLRRR
jgi:hypothetical protein